MLNVDCEGCSEITYAWSVVSGTKDELRGSVIARADVGHIWFSSDQLFSTAHKMRAHNQYHHRTLLHFGHQKCEPKDNAFVSPAKVTELEHSSLWIEQQILGFDVPMADPKWVDVGQAPEQLVHVQLHKEIHTLRL